MYILSSGMLKYTRLNDNDKEVVFTHDVAIGDYISECALWIEWMHRGTLTATASCQVTQVDAKSFQRVAHTFKHRDVDPSVYAQRVVDEINSRDMMDVSDLFVMS